MWRRVQLGTAAHQRRRRHETRTTQAWMATTRMASVRTARCECINGENLRGRAESEGAMYTYVR